MKLPIGKQNILLIKLPAGYAEDYDKLVKARRKAIVKRPTFVQVVQLRKAEGLVI